MQISRLGSYSLVFQSWGCGGDRYYWSRILPRKKKIPSLFPSFFFFFYFICFTHLMQKRKMTRTRLSLFCVASREPTHNPSLPSCHSSSEQALTRRSLFHSLGSFPWVSEPLCPLTPPPPPLCPMASLSSCPCCDSVALCITLCRGEHLSTCDFSLHHTAALKTTDLKGKNNIESQIFSFFFLIISLSHRPFSPCFPVCRTLEGGRPCLIGGLRQRDLKETSWGWTRIPF